MTPRPSKSNSFPTGRQLLLDSWQFFALYWTKFLGMVGLALVPFLAIALFRVSYRLIAGLVGTPDSTSALGSFVYWFFFLLTLLGYAGVVLISFPATYGQFILIKRLPKVRVWQAYSEALRSFWPYAALACLISLAMLAGAAAFLVTAVLAAVWWLPALPVMVFENTGVSQALRRSRELVSGVSWAVLARLLFWIGLSFCVQAVLLLPDALVRQFTDSVLLQSLGFGASAVLTFIWQVVALPLWLTYLAALYSALRNFKADDPQASATLSAGVKALLVIGLGIVGIFLTATTWSWLQGLGASLQ